MRSLGASAIGEALEVLSESIILYASIMPFHKIITMVTPIYIIHIIVGFLIIFPGAILVRIIKFWKEEMFMITASLSILLNSVLKTISRIMSQFCQKQNKKILLLL